MRGSHHSQITLITEDQAKDRGVTAENLRGKKIVDRDGQVIGTVKEVGLGSLMQSGGRSAHQTYGSTTSSQGSTGSSTSTNAPSTATGAYSMREGSASSSSYQNDQAVLYVKLDDKLEIKGKEMAVIPVSLVEYDREKKELKMQVGRSELASQLKLSSTSNR